MTSNSTERRVAVTGLGVVSSLGQDIDTFWNNIIAGRCGIDRITAFDASKFDCRIAAEVKRIDPELAHARETLWTPDKETPPTETKLWTPASKEPA